MCLVDPNKFWPGFTLSQPGFSKSCSVRFPQLHGTNIYIEYMGLFPGHESLTKNVSCGPKQILTCVYFHSAWFLKNLLGSFPSALRHQHCYRICFPWLENLKKDVPRFPWPSGPKQNLTCVDFPSSWFLKIYWCSFRSASSSRHQHMCVCVCVRLLSHNFKLVYKLKTA